jgi:hypothetical protein
VILSGAAVGTLIALGSPASATTVKGSPQPELKPFTLASKASDGGGSIAIEPSGTLVATYLVPSGSAAAAAVCVLPRAGRTCSHKTKLKPPGASTVDGSPQVFAPTGKVVDVVVSAPPNGTYVYRSTDGGVHFAAPVLVGTLEADEGELVANQIVFSDRDDASGARVEAIPTNPSGPPGSIATASTPETAVISVGSYHAGVLVANGGFSNDVIVSYAPSADDFNATASYARVGSFHNEDLLAMSGNALLTQSTKGKDPVRLRIFGGAGFGAAHTVPDGAGPGPEDYALVKDPGGEVHVFTVLAKYSYALYGVSTSTGAHWHGRQDFASAIADDDFAGALDSTGAGAVLGTEADGPVKIYPILPTQGVTFSLSKTSVHKGAKVTAKGKVVPAKKGRAVTLQHESGGLWHVVATAHETANGRYAFKIKATSTGRYRAVAADSAGFIQYGYSPAHVLHVTKHS